MLLLFFQKDIVKFSIKRDCLKLRLNFSNNHWEIYLRAGFFFLFFLINLAIQS